MMNTTTIHGADIFEKGGPYLARGAQDLVPTAELLDTYSPEIFCTLRNYHDVAPKVASFTGGADGTDGLDVVSAPLGSDFPDGLLVAMNSGSRNFLLFNWRDVAALIK